jgi:hypothetical protein
MQNDIRTLLRCSMQITLTAIIASEQKRKYVGISRLLSTLHTSLSVVPWVCICLLASLCNPDQSKRNRTTLRPGDSSQNTPHKPPEPTRQSMQGTNAPGHDKVEWPVISFLATTHPWVVHHSISDTTVLQISPITAVSAFAAHHPKPASAFRP